MESGIVRHYTERNGNQAGIPVVHIAINLQAGQDAQTDNFIRQAGFTTVANDVERRLARRFQASGQPIFAIINGVANSPSHRQWELLLNQSGYGTTRHPIDTFRSLIDQVKAPPAVVAPTIMSQPQSVTVVAGSDVTLAVSASGSEPLAYQWHFNGLPLIESTASVLNFKGIRLAQAGEYSVTISNSAGSITSAPAVLAVTPRMIAAAELRTVKRSSDATIGFVVVGTPGLTYRIEVSSDLVKWTPRADIQIERGEAAFVDAEARGNWIRFYRAVADEE